MSCANERPTSHCFALNLLLPAKIVQDIQDPQERRNKMTIWSDRQSILSILKDYVLPVNLGFESVSVSVSE